MSVPGPGVSSDVILAVSASKTQFCVSPAKAPTTSMVLNDKSKFRSSNLSMAEKLTSASFAVMSELSGLRRYIGPRVNSRTETSWARHCVFVATRAIVIGKSSLGKNSMRFSESEIFMMTSPPAFIPVTTAPGSNPS